MPKRNEVTTISISKSIKEQLLAALGEQGWHHDYNSWDQVMQEFIRMVKAMPAYGEPLQ